MNTITKRDEKIEITKGIIQIMGVLLIGSLNIFLGVLAWLAFAWLHISTEKMRMEMYGEVESSKAFFISSFLIFIFLAGGWAS